MACLTSRVCESLTVVAGGYLDLRFLCCYRGAGRRLNNGTMVVINGGVALVQAGGVLVGTG